jgi:hypothetical protein
MSLGIQKKQIAEPPVFKRDSAIIEIISKINLPSPRGNP